MERINRREIEYEGWKSRRGKYVWELKVGGVRRGEGRLRRAVGEVMERVGEGRGRSRRGVLWVEETEPIKWEVGKVSR